MAESVQKFSCAALGRAAVKLLKFDPAWLDIIAQVPAKPLAIVSIIAIVVAAVVQSVFTFAMLEPSVQLPYVLGYAITSQLVMMAIMVLVNLLAARCRKMPGQWLPLTFGDAVICNILVLVLMAVALTDKVVLPVLVLVPLLLVNLSVLVYLVLLTFFVIGAALRLQTFWQKLLWFIIISALVLITSTVLDHLLSLLFISLFRS